MCFLLYFYTMSALIAKAHWLKSYTTPPTCIIANHIKLTACRVGCKSKSAVMDSFTLNAVKEVWEHFPMLHEAASFLQDLPKAEQHSPKRFKGHGK